MTTLWHRARRWLRWLYAGMPRLDCDCPDDGRPIYCCMRCADSRCEVHRNHAHAESQR